MFVTNVANFCEELSCLNGKFENMGILCIYIWEFPTKSRVVKDGASRKIIKEKTELIIATRDGKEHDAYR
jgi:hypothetical protein